MGAQDLERSQLPLQFAQASQQLARQFERDWPSLARAGRERYYCIVEWHLEATADGDTVYVADRVALVALAGSYAQISNVGDQDCRKPTGEPLPVAHLHLTGDCSPSRADIETMLGRPNTFGLVICGPRSSVGYVPRTYLLALRGARHDH